MPKRRRLVIRRISPRRRRYRHRPRTSASSARTPRAPSAGVELHARPWRPPRPSPAWHRPSQ
ncbi:MAG: hypothetical protein CVT70_18715 [Alphaproteobacteria bacterium HGW-Alphaproteobacteria-1]|nr:MAG: hypothetical protein CVT70_18715 [Alphaproteobacteria bacterium HGW-Alphaproteobacteria-1]